MPITQGAPGSALARFRTRGSESRSRSRGRAMAPRDDTTELPNRETKRSRPPHASLAPPEGPECGGTRDAPIRPLRSLPTLFPSLADGHPSRRCAPPDTKRRCGASPEHAEKSARLDNDGQDPARVEKGRSALSTGDHTASAGKTRCPGLSSAPTLPHDRRLTQGPHRLPPSGSLPPHAAPRFRRVRHGGVRHAAREARREDARRHSPEAETAQPGSRCSCAPPWRWPGQQPPAPARGGQSA